MFNISERRFVLILVSAALLAATLACASGTGSNATQETIVTTGPLPEASATAGDVLVNTPTQFDPAVTTPPEATTDPAVPTPTAGTPEGTVPATNVSYEGIEFYWDLSVASSWGSTIEPPPDPNFQGPILPLPSHFRFTLEGYPVANPREVPRILVIPMDNFQGVSAPGLTYVEGVRAFIAEPPTDYTQVPTIAFANAAQVFHAQVKFLNFQNGSGVRFLTQYDQAPLPIHNQAMFYFFQGFTSDGKYFVAAFFPVSHPGLPADGAEPAGGWDAFAANMGPYLEDITKTLNDADPESFTPDLNILDAMMRSLKVKAN